MTETPLAENTGERKLLSWVMVFFPHLGLSLPTMEEQTWYK